MQELTLKEKKVYDYIIETIRRVGYSPSVRDIQRDLDIKSTSTVHAYLNKLEEKGYIQKENGKSRTLRVDSFGHEPQRSAKVPILGRVAAGMPILAVENCEGYIDFPLMRGSYPPNELFALRVRGESMIEAGILDGDIVIIRKVNYAENGEIVVALVEDEATVKTFYKENGHFRLQPENSTMDPIIVDTVYILGKVVSVMRFY
ncbi:MAG: transcriptional repressor LexA [Clostridia bacterium]|nr:transcriptional repressor LexA [Clostridia bacterium]MBQ4574962.1 transcriptional repressor LexA [Clostridia bacterium]